MGTHSKLSTKTSVGHSDIGAADFRQAKGEYNMIVDGLGIVKRNNNDHRSAQEAAKDNLPVVCQTVGMKRIQSRLTAPESSLSAKCVQPISRQFSGDGRLVVFAGRFTPVETDPAVSNVVRISHELHKLSS